MTVTVAVGGRTSGQHSFEILREILGYDRDAVDGLIAG